MAIAPIPAADRQRKHQPTFEQAGRLASWLGMSIRLLIQRVTAKPCPDPSARETEARVQSAREALEHAHEAPYARMPRDADYIESVDALDAAARTMGSPAFWANLSTSNLEAMTEEKVTIACCYCAEALQENDCAPQAKIRCFRDLPLHMMMLRI